jgi:hypothetical protein
MVLQANSFPNPQHQCDTHPTHVMWLQPTVLIVLFPHPRQNVTPVAPCTTASALDVVASHLPLARLAGTLLRSLSPANRTPNHSRLPMESIHCKHQRQEPISAVRSSSTERSPAAELASGAYASCCALCCELCLMLPALNACPVLHFTPQ